ncbi:MAG: amino acid ABC transporter permease [Mycobacterium sp.]
MTEILWASLPDLLAGLLVTVQLTVVSVGAGIPAGLLLALLTASRRRWVAWPVIVVVEILRGAPVIVLLQLVYYGLPAQGVTLAAMPSVWIAIGLSTAAYSSEIIRAGLQSVDPGQVEAAHALALGRRDTLRHIVLPQAVRVSVPPLMGLSIQMFQATSLAFAVSVPELISRAYNQGSMTFLYLEYLSLAGVLYAVIALPAIRVVARLERRMGLSPLTSFDKKGPVNA